MNRSITFQNADQLRWQTLLQQCLACPEDPTIITTLRHSLNSASRPVFARGIDKNEYVIKGQQAGRQIINDQIVARLGKAMNAPVAEPKIVEISTDLLQLELNFQYLTPGTAHGVIFIPDCSSDRETIQYCNQNANRKRFALLGALYGWVFAQDQQFIYQTKAPNLVFSVDHGHFFPGAPNWSIETLETAPRAEIDKHIRSTCRLTNPEIAEALDVLENVTEDTIIQAVASPPSEWGLTMNERVALVEYLLRRQQELLSSNLSSKA